MLRHGSDWKISFGKNVVSFIFILSKLRDFR